MRIPLPTVLDDRRIGLETRQYGVDVTTWLGLAVGTDHGIPSDQAIDWHQHGFYAYEACPLYDIRWTPTDAATIRDLLFGTGIDIDEWATRGLPASRVIAYLHAHVDVDEVDVFEAEPGGPEASLGMLAGLLG